MFLFRQAALQYTGSSRQAYGIHQLYIDLTGVWTGGLDSVFFVSLIARN